LRYLAPALLLLCAAAPAHALIGKNGVVFAAASLKGPLDKAIALLVRERRCLNPGATIRVSYASSGILARQIQQGAPADLFISADQRWIDYLVNRGRLLKADGESHILLTNRLVLVGRGSGGEAPVLRTGSETAQRLSAGRFAMGDPSHVPAGQYARAALQAMGLWSTVRRNAILAANVRIALAYVARGEAPLGIVYETDAVAEPRVRAIARFPANSHPPIRYIAAAVKGAGARCATEWLKHLMAPAARKIFQAAGYGIPGSR